MLEKLNEIYPVRYTAFLASVVLLVFTLLGAGVTGLSGWWPLLFLILSWWACMTSTKNTMRFCVTTQSLGICASCLNTFGLKFGSIF